jgi:predicted Zn-dependent peptidase
MEPADIFRRYTLPGGAQLNIRRERKFKTTLVKLFLTTNLGPDATKTALIPSVLKRGCKRFPSLVQIARHLEELYGAMFQVSIFKVGEWHLIQFKIEVLDNRYDLSSGNLLSEALSFLHAIACEPLTVRGGFRSSFVSQEKTALRKYIRSPANNKTAYALEKMFADMCRGEPYAVYEHGRIKDLKGITPAGLLRHYKKVLAQSPVSVYVIGDVDPDGTADLVRSKLDIPRGREVPPRAPVIKPAPKKPRRIVEKMDVKQGQLVMGFRTLTPYNDAGLVPLAFANGIFGAFPHSMLFRGLREERGLAYSVYSSLVRTKGLLYVYAGVSEKNFGRAEEGVLAALEAVKRGEFKRSDVEATRRSITASLQAVADSLGREIDNDFLQKLTRRGQTIKQMMDEVRRVSAGDIVRAARKITLDTVYHLRRGAE